MSTRALTTTHDDLRICMQPAASMQAGAMTLPGHLGSAEETRYRLVTMTGGLLCLASSDNQGGLCGMPL